MGADGAYPGGAAVAVVAGTVDVLYIERVKHPAPAMPCVVALHNILAAVIQISVAQQESKPAQLQIILVVLLDSVRNDYESELVYGAMPSRSNLVCAEFHCLIHFCIGERLVLPLVPAEAPEHA